jgi:hypothetical protein
MNQTDPTKFFLQAPMDRRATIAERDRTIPPAGLVDGALSFDQDGRPKFNLILTGRAKKNWKTADLILAGLYRLLAWRSRAGIQCYILANDQDQAGDDLELAKKIVWVNPAIADFVNVKQKLIERKDGKGFLEICQRVT